MPVYSRISPTSVCPSLSHFASDWLAGQCPSTWTLTCQRERGTTLKMSFPFPTGHRDLFFAVAKFDWTFCLGELGKNWKRERRREEGGKGDTTATICSMWPSLFSIRAAIHGMVLLITAHNTFSGMVHNIPVVRWTSRVANRRVHVQVCVCVWAWKCECVFIK